MKLSHFAVLPSDSVFLMKGVLQHWPNTKGDNRCRERKHASENRGEEEWHIS